MLGLLLKPHPIGILRILDLKCPSGLDGWIDRQKNGYDRFQL
jgi:hypothetical protein